MKILITGYPGTGKTSIAQELKKRGRYAYDPETMYTLMHLVDRETGRHIRIPKDAGRNWYDTVGAFNWDIPRVSSLLKAHETVFICSLADNMNLLIDEFDYIFVLSLDDFELQKRLEKRATGLSNNAAQLADILMLHGHFERSMGGRPNATIISVKPGVQHVVDTILKALDNDRKD